MSEAAEGQTDQNGMVQGGKKNFVWDSSSKELFGRTWDSWAKIAVFYLIFYSCLAAFFAALMVGFYQTLDPKKPTQLDLKSLLKANPGMGFRPMPNMESTLIKVQQGNQKQYSLYTDALTSFMGGYYNQTGDNLVNCTETTDGGEMAEGGKACAVSSLFTNNPCTSLEDFSYDEGTPCVALKINKIFGWVPEPFSTADFEDSNNTFAQEAKKLMAGRYDPAYIGISCEGENDADIDNMGPIRFFPDKGFPSHFYPYVNQDNYKAPVVFVKFDSPANGVLIQVWCRIWTKNIRHHKNDKAGSIHFELLID